MPHSNESSALLSSAELGVRLRKLVSWSAAQRQVVLARVESSQRDWCGAWGLNVSARSTQNGATALGEDEARRILGGELFPHPAATVDLGRVSAIGQGLAESICQEAWDDWVVRLGRVLDLSVAEVSAAHHRALAMPDMALEPAWSGQLDLTVPWWSGTWTLRLRPECVQKMLGMEEGAEDRMHETVASNRPLVAVDLAAGRKVVALQVELESVSLSLGEIQHLRIGDIVTLPHRLHEPAHVSSLNVLTGESSPLCAAWLGQNDGRVAVQLCNTSVI